MYFLGALAKFQHLYANQDNEHIANTLNYIAQESFGLLSTIIRDVQKIVWGTKRSRLYCSVSEKYWEHILFVKRRSKALDYQQKSMTMYKSLKQAEMQQSLEKNNPKSTEPPIEQPIPTAPKSVNKEQATKTSEFMKWVCIKLGELRIFLVSFSLEISELKSKQQGLKLWPKDCLNLPVVIAFVPIKKIHGRRGILKFKQCNVFFKEYLGILHFYSLFIH